MVFFFIVGSSKKKAKHAAAQSALNILMGVTNGDEAKEEKVYVYSYLG